MAKIFRFFIKRPINLPPGGCIPSPPDKRDVLTSEVFPEVKRIPETCPPPFDLTVLNQNGYPHCVGYACAAMKQEKEMRERKALIFDGDWIYKKCKEMDGLPNLRGTYLRIGMKVLQKIGAKPKDEKEEEAGKYKIGGYARVDTISFENLKKAIFVNGAVLAGFKGSNEGWRSAYIRPPKANERAWGHAVLLIGYTKNYLIGLNSWGERWGDKGLFYVPRNYMPFEAWSVLVDLPSSLLVPSSKLEGWVASRYLKPSLIEGNVVYPYVRLNLRKEPYGERITTLARYQRCVVVSDETKKKGQYNWVKIRVL